MDTLKKYIETHKDRFINELIALLKIPSVSADSSCKKDTISAAKFIAKSLYGRGNNNAYFHHKCWYIWVFI